MSGGANGSDTPSDDLGPTTPRTEQVEHLVRALVGMMRGGGVTELDVAFAGVSVRLRGTGAVIASHGDPSRAPVDEATPAPAGHVVTAPMVGTFYASPNPGAAPYVRVGDTISPGTVIGIIEAMKIMNEITADRDGVVEEIVAVNAQAVEFGFPLIRLRAGS